KLEALYRKHLPKGVPIGESWEITDRPGDVSVIANGALAGRDLHWLMEHHARDLLGQEERKGTRFPLLVKILDASERLSVQLHPSETAAPSVGGEPKAEFWFVAQTAKESDLFVGFKYGISKEQFLAAVGKGNVSELLNHIYTQPGDTLFIPSGQIHAIGAGN